MTLKNGKIKLYKFMEANSGYESHSRSHTIELRLMHKYANAYMFILI